MSPESDAALSRREIQHRASRGALWTAIHATVSIPLNVVGTVITARVLGVEGYAELAYLTVVLAVVLQISDLGYTSSAVQWGSRARVAGDDAELNRRLSAVTGFHLMVQGPLYVIASVIVLREFGVVSAVTYAGLSVAFLYVSSLSLALVLDQRNDQLARIALVSNIVTQALVIAAVLMYEDPISVLLVRSAAALLPGLVAIVFVRPALRGATLLPAKPWSTPSGYRSFALYSWVASSIAILVYSRSEIILLRGLSDPEQTALFALAFSISQQLTGPVDALVAPLIPATASLVAAHGEHVGRAVRRSMTLSSLLAGGLLAAPIPALFGLFPLLYGSNFRDAATLLVVLGAISTFQTATSLVGVLVQAQRRGRGLLVANVAALVVNVAVALALIPVMGAWGAMIANCAGQLTSILMLVRAATQAGDVSAGLIAAATRPWWAAVPATVVAVLLAHTLTPAIGHLPTAAVAGLVGLALYVGTLRTTHWGPAREDLDALVSTLPVRLRTPVRACCKVVAA